MGSIGAWLTTPVNHVVSFVSQTKGRRVNIILPKAFVAEAGRNMFRERWLSASGLLLHFREACPKFKG